MVYSVLRSRNNALARELRQAKVMASTKCNQDFNLAHASETRDGAKNDFTLLIKRVKDDFQKRLTETERRKTKLGK